MIGIEWILIYLALGAFVGFVAGLLGVGGGGIMVPMLTSIFIAQGFGTDNAVHLALGTSMASIIVTSFSSLRAHNRNNAVLWPVVKSMSWGILLGTFIATFIAAKANAVYLAIFFSLFMAFVAYKMFSKSKPKAERNLLGNTSLFFSGTGLGGISALVSIGGGAISIPFLIWQNVEAKKAIGTSAALGLPIAITGTMGFAVNGWGKSYDIDYTLGFVYLPAVLLMSCTSYFLAPVGAKLAHNLPVPILKKIFAVLLLGLSVKMLFSVI